MTTIWDLVKQIEAGEIPQSRALELACRAVRAAGLHLVEYDDRPLRAVESVEALLRGEIAVEQASALCRAANRAAYTALDSDADYIDAADFICYAAASLLTPYAAIEYAVRASSEETVFAAIGVPS